MNIRNATIDDLATCSQLSDTPELHTAGGNKTSIETYKAYLDDEFFLIAEEDGVVVGFILAE